VNQEESEQNEVDGMKFFEADKFLCVATLRAVSHSRELFARTVR